MLSYPSTHGLFDEKIKQYIEMTHAHGGQVFIDGTNLNSQIGWTSPGQIGADLCYVNLHKTFAIPHGGSGFGVGAICVAEHLAAYLPGHPVIQTGGSGVGVNPKLTGAVSPGPYGSAGILPIAYMYIKMLGAQGLKESTSVAILNGNYLAKNVGKHYNILSGGKNSGNEFIIDVRPFKVGKITAEDVVRRLQDYGFHFPKLFLQVPGTIIVEATEIENKNQLDNFVNALISIRKEIDDVLSNKTKYDDSPLRHAPHTIEVLTSSEWNRSYSREVAAYPAPWLKENKFWPSVTKK